MTDETFGKSLEIKAGQTASIPAVVGNWWKEVSAESHSPASPGKLYAIGNYLVQLVKNSLSDGKSDGAVDVLIDGEKVKLTIDDLGGEEKEINLNFAGDYGMKEAIEYFDIFMVESRGKKYEKNRRNMIEETDESDTYAGSKVTIVKYHVTPIDEYEEEYRVKRNFDERM